MATRFSQSFKNNVVEKTLNRAQEVTIEDIAKDYGLAISTVGRWLRESKQTALGNQRTMTIKEKRPQDWHSAEKLQVVFDCENLDEEAQSAYCRQQGLYPHHIKQWKQAIIDANKGANKHVDKTQLKLLKDENKQLKQELNRKEKALAETAALLVLKKKVQTIWASDEVN